jgi:hypothetical protein
MDLLAQGLIACDGADCDFGDLITTIKNIIEFLIMLSTGLAAIGFAYAGFLLLTSGGNEGAKTRAKEVFRKILIGFLWILGAWLVVYTILSALVSSTFNYLG